MCYFVIVILPLLLILCYTYGVFIRNESKECLNRLSTSLQSGVRSVDTYIDAAEKAGLSLFYDKRVKRHLKPISECSVEDRTAQIEIHSTINALTSITDAVTQTMLVYLDDQHVFSDGLYSFEDYFNNLYAFRDYDTDFWRSLLDENHVLEMLPATSMEQKWVNNVQQVIPVIHTTRASGRKVVLVIILSVDDIVSTVKSNLNIADTQIVIMDQEEGLIYGDFAPQIILQAEENRSASLKINREAYHLISVSSEANKLQYYLAVPESVIFSISDDCFFFIIAALSTSVIAGILAFYFAKKISSPIQHIYSSIDDNAANEPKSIMEVSQRFHFFFSNYQETREEEKYLRTDLVEMSLLQMLSGNNRHIQKLACQLEQEYAFTYKIYQLCVVKVFFSCEANEMQDTERINLQLNFRSDLAAYLSRKLLCLVLEDCEDQYICLVNRNTDDQVLRETMEQLLLQMKDSGIVEGMHVSLAMGCELKDLGSAYGQVVRTLVAIRADEPFALRNVEETVQQPITVYTLRDELTLLNVLRSRDKEKIYDHVNRRLYASGQVGSEQENLCIYDLFVTGMRYLAEQDETLQDQKQYHGLRADVELPGGLEAKRQLLKRFFDELMQIQHLGTESNLTSSIMDYVQQHYASDLYLERIAQEMGLSVKYISKVFKEKIGRNLSDYINEVRIQHVKDMLVNTNMSIASISDAVGIYSRSTFVRLFRKYEGVTPSEYRELFTDQKKQGL